MSRPAPPVFASQAELWGSTGMLDMSVFHMSSAGNTGHPPMLGPEFDWTTGAVVVGVTRGGPPGAEVDVGAREEVTGRDDVEAVVFVTGALVEGMEVTDVVDDAPPPAERAGARGSTWPEPVR